MKHKLNPLDLRILLSALYRLRGMRFQNSYDISDNKILIKFRDPAGEKINMFIYTGITMCLTDYNYDYLPSSKYCLTTQKIRKYLANKIVTNVSQYLLDRVFIITFCHDPNYRIYLVLEFFSQGNIILLDNKMNVLACKRKVEQASISVSVGLPYLFPYSSQVFPSTLDSLKSRLDTISMETPSISFSKALQMLPNVTLQHIDYIVCLHTPDLIPSLKMPLLTVKKDHNDKYNGILNMFLESPVLVQDWSFMDENIRPALADKLDGIPEKIKHIPPLQDTSVNGYIVLNNPVGNADPTVFNMDIPLSAFKEYTPFMLEHQKKPKSYVELKDFNTAINMFISMVDRNANLKANELARKKSGTSKVEATKNRIDKRISDMEHQSDICKLKSRVIMHNSNLVEIACTAIQIAVSSGYSWSEIEKLILSEQKKKLEAALCIKSLNLKISRIVLTLPIPPSEDYFQTSPNIDVEVNPMKDPHSNAQEYYNIAGQHATKIEKTKAKISVALKSSLFHQQQQAKRGKQLPQITPCTKQRSPMWMEKFTWFISSDGYIVIAGKDAQQNERLVKMYLNEGDVYVHAQIHGASSVIIKNFHTFKSITPTTPEEQAYLSEMESEYANYNGYLPIPMKTIEEAGQMAVCYSKAWEQKVPSSAYWVHANQVSKIANKNEFLKTGMFMIRGKRNFLPHTKLEYGYGLVFKYSVPKVQDDSLVLPDIDNADNIVNAHQTPEDLVASIIHKPITTVPLLQAHLKLLIDPKIKSRLEKLFLTNDTNNGTNEHTIADDEEILIDFGPASKKIVTISKSKNNPKSKKIINIDTESESEPISPKKSQQTPKQSQPQKVITKIRGKKSKLAKIKKKYKDQDDDERIIRMKMMGVKNPEESKLVQHILAKSNNDNNDDNSTSEPACKPLQDQENEADDSDLYESNSHIDSDSNLKDSHVPEISLANEISSLTLLPKPKAPPIDPSALAMNYNLSGKLSDNVDFDHIIPIAAPISAIEKLSYYVKLRPGQAKKGAICNSIKEIFLKKLKSESTADNPYSTQTKIIMEKVTQLTQEGMVSTMLNNAQLSN